MKKNKILCNDVLQNFPFLEDDFDALTDYELFCKGFNYLDKEKANKKEIPDVSNFITKDVNNLTNYYDKDTTDDLLDNKANVSDIPDVSNFITKDVNNLTNYYDKDTTDDLLDNKENIIETGSNTNGNYIKFDNGILIQWNRIIVNDQAISSPYGSLFQGTRNITFPIPFVGDLPTVQCSEFQYGSGATWGCTVGNGTTLTETALRGWDCFSRDAGTNCRISWMAIGKWK